MKLLNGGIMGQMIIRSNRPYKMRNADQSTLLEESSYGCKVTVSAGNSSYEMRKIRRYTEWQSMPYKEKSQYDEFQKIQTALSKQAGIPKIIIDEALRYHKKDFRNENI